MRCQLRSADRTLYDGDASLVVAQSPRGEFAIMDGHAPLIAVLAPGAIRIQDAGQEHVYVCRGGTLRVGDDATTLLVESALALDEIDAESVHEQLAALGASEDSAADDEEYLLALQAAMERHG